MLASEAALEVMALTTVVLCVFGLTVGVAILRRAWRRLALYPGFGSRRAYARQQMYIAVSMLLMVALFFFTGLTLSLLPDTDLRAAVARLLVLAVVVDIVVLQIVYPVSQARIEALRSQELEAEKAREGND